MLKLETRLQEIGAIKIGELGETKNKQSGTGTYRLPKKLDSILVVRKVRGAEDTNFVRDKEIMDKLVAEQGPRPMEVPIVFLSNNIADVWQSYRGWYHGNGRTLCRSEDGETAYRVKKKVGTDGKEEILWNDLDQMPCPNINCEFAQKKWCKSHGRLQFIIPLAEELGGVYTFRTTSWFSVNNIQNQLLYFLHLSHGLLSGIPFVLRMLPKTSKVQGVGEITFYEVGIFYKGKVTEFLQLASQRTYDIMLGKQKVIEASSMYQKVLAADFTITTDEVEEFNPESVELKVPMKALATASNAQAATQTETKAEPAAAAAETTPAPAATEKIAQPQPKGDGMF